MTMKATAPSDQSYDFNAFNDDDEVWNGTAFVTLAVADYLTYRIAATKVGDANDPLIQAIFKAADVTGATYFVLRERGTTLALSTIEAGPASTDAADKAATRAAISGRWTNLGTATDRDDISVGDIP